MKASEVAERIARGEPCPCCGAEWTKGPDNEPWVHEMLTHTKGCSWSNRPDTVQDGDEFEADIQ